MGFGNGHTDGDQESRYDMNETSSNTQYSSDDFSIDDSSTDESDPFAVSIRPENLADFFGANYPTTSDTEGALSKRLMFTILKMVRILLNGNH